MTGRSDGKRVVVGLSGGIACYKVPELVRLLRAGGARVRVVMTRAACEFITPLTLQTLSGEPVATDLFDLTQESEIGHISLADDADAIVVAPATANLIGRAAAGLGDDLLTTVLLATRAPVLLAPAMNVHMWENALVQENLARLQRHGWRVIAPGVGALACGYEGAGRLAEPAVIAAEVERALGPQDLQRQRVLVTAGPNREPIDPVRFISNRSTGRMGYALAAAAWRRGADVTLISGPTALPDPHGVHCVRVQTAAEMHAAVLREFPSSTILLMAAAVADYRPATTRPQKLKKTDGPMQLELARTVDILGALRGRAGRRLMVGFAAETNAVEENAARKLESKGLDLIVANDVTASNAGFEVETNAVTLIDADGRTAVPLASKDAVADRILDKVVEIGRARAARVVKSGRQKARGKRS
ncbi:MAG TPA: bifunctional phosphopantothenoylcysteine decarboxylase/phosphopantothenate--cysteine ligase CoaBC [Candidatus Dormibacteraeota bacterium]|nr:bifunctional phosphopantothenoylcysteine decarboxylase/phosphopantothenate--cysteine ligase CoaBC [Candidatus Dormibacteraeota bacterium]